MGSKLFVKHIVVATNRRPHCRPGIARKKLVLLSLHALILTHNFLDASVGMLTLCQYAVIQVMVGAFFGGGGSSPPLSAVMLSF